MFPRLIPMSTSVSPSARKGFDYASLDAETFQFVQQQTGEIRVLMKRTAESIVAIGQRLIEIKQKLGHGQFGDWLEAEFEWSEGTARRFMSVARNLPELDHGDRFEARALYLLASPSTPQGARQEALELASAGESITYTAAQAIKQKHTLPLAKPQAEPISQPQPQPSLTPALAPQSGSKLEIVALHHQTQAPALSEPTRVILPQAAQAPRVPYSSPPVYTSEPGVWWRLGGRHLLYCGDPNSPELLGQITEEVQLLLAFPPTPDWQPGVRARSTISLNTQYLSQGNNLTMFEDMVELMLLLYSSVMDMVVSCFLPSPEILSIINRLDRRGIFAEPDSRRFNKVISDWKRAGLKAEQLS